MHIFPVFLIFLRLTINEFEDNQNDQSELSLDEIAGEVDNKAVDDFDLSPDSLKLVKQEEKQMMPHKETTELINLNPEEKQEKEMKISITTGLDRIADKVK